MLLGLADVLLPYFLGIILVGNLACMTENIDRLSSIAVFLSGKRGRKRNNIVGKNAILEGICSIMHDLPELVRIIGFKEQLLMLEATFDAFVRVVDVLDLVTDSNNTDATIDFPRLFGSRKLHQQIIVVHQIDLVENDDDRIEL